MRKETARGENGQDLGPAGTEDQRVGVDGGRGTAKLSGVALPRCAGVVLGGGNKKTFSSSSFITSTS